MPVCSGGGRWRRGRATPLFVPCGPTDSLAHTKHIACRTRGVGTAFGDGERQFSLHATATCQNRAHRWCRWTVRSRTTQLAKVHKQGKLSRGTMSEGACDSFVETLPPFLCRMLWNERRPTWFWRLDRTMWQEAPTPTSVTVRGSMAHPIAKLAVVHATASEQEYASHCVGHC